MAEYIDREAALKAIAEDKIEMTPELIAISRAIGTYTAEQAFDGINQACDRHIESIKILPAADVQPVNWIPVTERLPNGNGKYLVSGKDKVWVCEFMKLGDVGGWCNSAMNPCVKYWMPLPEPPKDGETCLIHKMKKRRFCKLNGYFCPDCIYHDFVWEGITFRGNRCRYPKDGET